MRSDTEREREGRVDEAKINATSRINRVKKKKEEENGNENAPL